MLPYTKATDSKAKTYIIDIRTHIKPTNKQLYVHASSHHPPSILAAISKGETHRYLRTNSDANNFKKMTLNLIHRLKHRQYKQNQILKHGYEIKFNQRPESLTKRKQKEPKLVFTTNYCDDIIKCVLKKHWKLIEQNETLREISRNYLYSHSKQTHP